MIMLMINIKIHYEVKIRHIIHYARRLIPIMQDLSIYILMHVF